MGVSNPDEAINETLTNWIMMVNGGANTNILFDILGQKKNHQNRVGGKVFGMKCKPLIWTIEN